jgi:hypothetical protein
MIRINGKQMRQKLDVLLENNGCSGKREVDKKNGKPNRNNRD